MTTRPAAAAAVAVFAPVTILTVTLERPNGDDEVHIHPGGQGVWQARMITTLGARAVLCTPLGGEPGAVLDRLLDNEGIEHPRVPMPAANPTWLHDRRQGERTPIWESPPFAIGRHELDELFSATLAAALSCGTGVLAGTHEGQAGVDPDTYRRLASDLRASGVAVVADVTGDELEATLRGGPHAVKVADDDMRRDGRLTTEGHGGLVALVARLHAEGARHVVVSRSRAGALASDGKTLLQVDGPQLDVADARGAGDSMTAALAVGVARGLSWEETLRLAVAAGAVNVTRHGSGSGRADAIHELADRIEIREAVST